jgi:hypothetical protein
MEVRWQDARTESLTVHCSAAFASPGPHLGRRDRDPKIRTGTRRHTIRFMSSPTAAGTTPAAF